jgi:hypothetical protein
MLSIAFSPKLLVKNHALEAEIGENLLMQTLKRLKKVSKKSQQDTLKLIVPVLHLTE